MTFSGARLAAFPNGDGSASSIALTMRKFWWFACTPSFSATRGFSQELLDQKTIWEERYRSIVDLEQPPASQWDPDRQNLSPPLEGRAEKAIPRSH